MLAIKLLHDSSFFCHRQNFILIAETLKS